MKLSLKLENTFLSSLGEECYEKFGYTGSLASAARPSSLVLSQIKETFKLHVAYVLFLPILQSPWVFQSQKRAVIKSVVNNKIISNIILNTSGICNICNLISLNIVHFMIDYPLFEIFVIVLEKYIKSCAQ